MSKIYLYILKFYLLFCSWMIGFCVEFTTRLIINPLKTFLDNKEKSVIEPSSNVDCDNGVNDCMESDNTSDDCMHQILQNPFIEISQLGEIQLVSMQNIKH